MGISIGRIKGHIEKLVTHIGPRTMGSREDQSTMDYITGLLREWGCDVRLHTISCPCWQHRGTSLTLLGSGQSLPAQACQFSAACDIAGEILPIGSPSEANNAPVAGKICLMHAGIDGSVTQRCLIALALEARGAKGLIVNSNHSHPDAFDGKIVREPDLRRMPVASVSGNAARRIIDSGSPVRLQIDASFWHGTTCNIQAVIPGSGPGRIFLTAHHDTGAGAPGAVDNGAGTAILLELARLFAGETPPCELRFVFCGGHERLGQGSLDYVRDNPELLEDAIMNLNLDGVGQKQGPLTALVSAPEPFTDRFVRIPGIDGVWNVTPVDEITIDSDATAFAQKGLPAISLNTLSEHFHYGHTQFDDMDALDMELVDTAARAALEIIGSQFWVV